MVSHQAARTIYFIAGAGIAGYAWVSWSDALPLYKDETLFVPTILLYVLALPISVLVQVVYIGLTLLAPPAQINFGSAFLNWMAKTWALLVIAGYMQWFVIFPRIIHRSHFKAGSK